MSLISHHKNILSGESKNISDKKIQQKRHDLNRV
nr:MAG TPA: hypothetical protein [Caudoviricetes sp.]